MAEQRADPGGAVGAAERAAERHRVLVRGVVQGIGFRPFVHALATELGLGGFVHNRPDGVLVEIEGEPERLGSFVVQLRARCPAVGQIEDVLVTALQPQGEREFRIQPSESPARAQERFFSPDVGTCDDCVRELFDPRDRRHRYPFLNCARCGPRLTIIRGAPYDRERTTMARFALCDRCREEYEDPRDRRFHAQAIACPACGPRLLAHDADGHALDVDPLSFARELLASDRIVAVKGLGGYHLACDATHEAAVLRLRARKHRDEKPFAVLARDLEAARRFCRVSPEEAQLLTSPRGPIVLLRRLTPAPVAQAVAPGNPLLGVMLPYTPLHHLLVRERADRPLVLTSANRSDEPIVCDDGEALARLRGIADGFLTHDRPIHLRCDDSVARVVGDRPLVLRRSRGYAPEPIRLPLPCARPVLALGGHLKSTFALGRGERAFVSNHVGDLGDHGAYRAFCEAVARYESLFAFEPDVLVHDLHPSYATTEYARERLAETPGLRLVAVQHHHAHMASCMAENGLVGPVIGVTFDGSGYGIDGSLWGGELLVGDYRSFRRAAHLRPVPLPGGERAIREPWRVALAHLVDCEEGPDRLAHAASPEALRVVHRMIERGLNAPLTTSVGRLFDAVAALLDLRSHVSFEGQAAMELEWLAGTSDAHEPFPFDLDCDEGDEPLVIDMRPMIRGILAALRAGERAPDVARRLHATIADVVARVAARLAQETGIHDVVLTGGVFQNALLLGMVEERLSALDLRAHRHSRVPPNDGGLSLGQLAIAAASQGSG